MDIECPYCEKELDINHDDGYGYDENILHQQYCGNCEKTFVFRTSIVFYYEAEKADCLNGGKHNYQLSHTHPKEFSEMVCNMCYGRRELTDIERTQYNIRTIESYFKSLENNGAKN